MSIVFNNNFVGEREREEVAAGVVEEAALPPPQQATPTSTSLMKPESGMNLAASWYIAMPSAKLPSSVGPGRRSKKKKPYPLRLFGSELIAWRDQHGQPVIMDGHCIHTGGASLAEATLTINEEGDTCVRCPFHGRTYNRTGACVAIPGATASPYQQGQPPMGAVLVPPPSAAQPVFPVVEKYGYIWVWYGTPQPLFDLPDFQEYERARAGNNKIGDGGGKKQEEYQLVRFEFPTKTSVRRIIENLFDQRHVVELHGLGASSIEFLADDLPASRGFPELPRHSWMGGRIVARAQQYVGFGGWLSNKLGLNFDTYSLNVAVWPSGSKVSQFFDSTELSSSLNGVTPVGPNETILHSVFLIRKTSSWWRDKMYWAIFTPQTKAAAGKDVAVWNSLKEEGAAGRPPQEAYGPEDRALVRFRKFYQGWVKRKSS